MHASSKETVSDMKTTMLTAISQHSLQQKANKDIIGYKTSINCIQLFLARLLLDQKFYIYIYI